MKTRTPKGEKLWELLDGFSVAMVTTLDSDLLRARPMAPFVDAGSCTVRFLTHRSSAKVDEIEEDNRACISLMSVASNSFVSVSGRLRIDEDRTTVRRLWGPYASTWFEFGPDNPDIVALVLDIERAEYWDGTLNVLRGAWEVANALGTSKIPRLVDHQRIG